MTTDALFGILRFTDGLFPSGGYAHSMGLETCVQRGAIADGAGAEHYIRAYLEASAGPCDAVAAVNALMAARRGDFDAILKLDCALDAMKPAAEMREASRQMGRQTVRIAAATVDTGRGPGDASIASDARPAMPSGVNEVNEAKREAGPSGLSIASDAKADAVILSEVSIANAAQADAVILSEASIANAAKDLGQLRASEAGTGSPIAQRSLLTRLERAAAQDATPCHHAIVFGAIGGVAGWTPEQCAAALLYAAGAQLVGAALRLMPIGQLDGQRILARAGDLIARLAREAAARRFDEAWSFAPGVEIAAMQHAQLEARLFRS